MKKLFVFGLCLIFTNVAFARDYCHAPNDNDVIGFQTESIISISSPLCCPYAVEYDIKQGNIKHINDIDLVIRGRGDYFTNEIAGVTIYNAYYFYKIVEHNNETYKGLRSSYYKNVANNNRLQVIWYDEKHDIYAMIKKIKSKTGEWLDMRFVDCEDVK